MRKISPTQRKIFLVGDLFLMAGNLFVSFHDGGVAFCDSLFGGCDKIASQLINRTEATSPPLVPAKDVPRCRCSVFAAWINLLTWLSLSTLIFCCRQKIDSGSKNAHSPQTLFV